MDTPATAHEPETQPTARARRWPRMLAATAALVGVAVASSLTTVWATHSFPDVPNNSPHHADISWAVDNAITQGYNDGNFRPKQAVSRQQMATFLHRLSNRFRVVDDSFFYPGLGSTYTASANCSPGERALAGGALSDRVSAAITNSYPVADTWFVTFRMDDGNQIGPVTGTVYVLCGPSS